MVPSILPFVAVADFDERVTRIMGQAFDLACRELRDAGQRNKRYFRSITTKSTLRLFQWFEARRWREQPISQQATFLLAPIANIAPELIERCYRGARKRSKRFAHDRAPQATLLSLQVAISEAMINARRRRRNPRRASTATRRQRIFGGSISAGRL